MDKIQSSLQLTVIALNTCTEIFMDTLDGYGFLAHQDSHKYLQAHSWNMKILMDTLNKPWSLRGL